MTKYIYVVALSRTRTIVEYAEVTIRNVEKLTEDELIEKAEKKIDDGSSLKWEDVSENIEPTEFEVIEGEENLKDENEDDK